MPAKALPLQLHMFMQSGGILIGIELRVCRFAKSQLLWASAAALLSWVVCISWKFFLCYPCVVAGNRQALKILL